ncbi:PAS domain S-box protein [Aestuariibaculum sp. YM273]|uniref:PAS domain-containing sensor histidine kinase n=1 Tax=Aestuariibaculum sp. YM273 TaxID=3070659 RepID=UPI0027DCB3E3|nr:PAS domain-containing sensor histidine kinase [Aestuariibaculum sp. YM273]WMI65418.1 PAS domain S-box protein [Aestuariibaculum sp. YM273]
MSQDIIDILKQQLAEEKAARISLEKELSEANKKLEYINTNLQDGYDGIVDAFLIMDLSGNILKMNESARNILDFKDDGIGYNLMSMVNPEDLEMVSTSFKQLLNEGVITNFELKIKTPLQNYKVVQINGNILYENNKPVAAQGIIRDITKSKEAEEKLRESENRLATVVLNLDKGILLEDENRNIIVTNTKFCEFFNIPLQPEELVGNDCQSAAEQVKHLFKESDGFVNRINSIIQSEEVVVSEELEMVDGHVLERDYVPVFRDGKIKGHLWTYKDVTLRRQFRENLDQERLKYRNVITKMSLGLVEVDMNDRITVANENFLRMSGYSAEELIGSDAKKLFKYEQEFMEEKRENRDRGMADSYELKMVNKSGEERDWLISVAPNYDNNGNIIGAIGIHLDITNVKSLEREKVNLLEALERSNNELQEYAHIVSHDLKSPLRSINALVSWIKDDNKGALDAPTIQNLGLIETTLERMEQLISDVLLYSSIGFYESEKEPVNVQEVVQDLLHILFIPEHITVYILKPLPVVFGHKTKIQQLFQNLISNAIKFIDKEKGLIYISYEEQPDCYQFSVQDNGMGIEKKYHDKIFKVFHALKKSNDSTGIGLSIVQKIVELHNGKIWLESKPNKGTTFFFTLKKGPNGAA